MGVEIRKGWFCVFVGINIMIVVAMCWAMIAVPGFALAVLKVLMFLAAWFAGRFVAEKLWRAVCPRKESSDGVQPDRVEPDRVGAVQVLDPGLEIATARRNGMGVPVHSPAAELPFGNGGMMGGPVPIRNNSEVAIRIRSQIEDNVVFRRMTLALREILGPTEDDPYFRRGTPHYREALRILGARARLIRNESVRQINGRYLKADQFLIDESGFPVRDDDEGIKTRSVRIRIPRDSWLRKDFKHSRTRADA